MPRLIVIVGPTAVGKTSLSLAIAKHFDAEVISADAMQFYKGLDIGTAKIQSTEMQGIKHHLIDFLNPEDSFSVADYQNRVREKIKELKNEKKNIVIVGGSGLYLQAALYDYDFSGEKRSSETYELYQDQTNQELHELLMELNPEIGETVHPNNRRRLLRSLEIAKDKTLGYLNKGKHPLYPEMTLIGLNLDRSKLYDLINQRVDAMFEKGLVEEVRYFYDAKVHSQSLMAIGYKELYLYFDGLISLEESIELIKLHSRRYAKRQLTWFHNKMEIEWFVSDLEHFDNTVNEVIDYIKKIE